MIGRRLLAPSLGRPLSTMSSGGAAGAAAAAGGGEAAASSSSSSSTPPPPPSWDARSRAELVKFHPYIRTAQVAEALRRGFEEGQLPARCTGHQSSNTADLEAAALVKATRARPSLLVPVAGTVGVGLRCLTQLLPVAFPVGKGVLSSIEETLDDGIRAMIQLGQQGEEGDGVAAAEVKALLKKRRDGVVHASGAESGGGEPLAQGAQLLCRTLLKAAERM